MVQPGERFGSYEPLTDSAGQPLPVSETNDSITFEGRDSTTGKKVAIRVSRHPEPAPPSRPGIGSHPNILPVLAAGSALEGRRFEVTPWCEGGGLLSYIGSLSFRPLASDFIQWFHQAASALAEIHAAGLTHPALDPSHLLIDYSDESAVLKLSGVGRPPLESSSLDRTFAAPEAVRGQVTPASDIYSLAIIFCRLLGATRSPVESCGFEFPSSLDSKWRLLLVPMLSADPAKRPANGAALLSLLRADFPGFSPAPVPWSGPLPVEEPPPVPAPVPGETIREEAAADLPLPPPPPLPVPVPVAEQLPPPPPLPPAFPIEAERTEQAASPRPAPSMPPPPPPVPVEIPPSPAAPAGASDVWGAPAPAASPRPAPQKSSAAPLLAALVVLAAVGGGGYFAWQRFKPLDKLRGTAATGTTPVATSGTAAPAISPDPHKPHPAEVLGESKNITQSTDSKPVDANQPSPAITATPPPQTLPPAEPTPAPANPEPPKVIKVPGDATTIGGALARCPSGGTIEVNGGTYRESLLLTRPVTILASGDATLEDDGKSPTLLIAKGENSFNIRGLVIRNAQAKGSGNPEEKPALLLIASGAKVRMEKCTVEGGQGDGMTVADHGNAELVECRVMKNRGFGTRVSGGSTLTVTGGSIQENGLGGVWISNTGTSLSVNDGGNVNRNSNNGIQATDGATVEINGGGVSFNRTNGIIALDAGTKVLVKESGLVSDNSVNGIAMVNGATATVSSARIERNQNYGILAERSGKLALSGAILRSNSMAGIFFNEGGNQTCRIERSEFSDHSEFGAAFVGGEIFVSGCTFSENGGALLLGKDTRGEIRGNTISPGPISTAIVREEAGEIKEMDNTVR